MTETSLSSLKTCFKCRVEKSSAEFYRHPEMGDGLLGKCKSCTKNDVRKNYRKKLLDPEWSAQEAARQREKEKKRYHRTLKGSSQYRIRRRASRARYARKYPEKVAANTAVNNAIRDRRLYKKPCEECGTIEGVQAHHDDDYTKPLKVRWLCPEHHGIQRRKR